MGTHSQSILVELQKNADAKKAALFQRFFKTGKGEYAEGDKFLGLTVPQVRSIAKKYVAMTLPDIVKLLQNPYHEARLAALVILIHQYEKAGELEKEEIATFYVNHRKYVNNWDLVDVSAYKILGAHLVKRSRNILSTFAKEDHLWTQRIAIVSTFAFIRIGQCGDTIKLAELFLRHPHDLMHKATGWMLREVGKRDIAVLRSFLDRYAMIMPRTMLRYAIEKMSDKERGRYLGL